MIKYSADDGKTPVYTCILMQIIHLESWGYNLMWNTCLACARKWV